MQDGEILYHHPVRYHRDGERHWYLWCDDCDLYQKYDSESAADRDWWWHLRGEIHARIAS